MPDVEVTLGAQDAELVRAWQRAKQGPKELALELDRVQKKSHDVDNSLGAAATNLIAKYGSVASAIGLATKGLRDLAAARGEIRREESQTTVQLDAAFRSFAAQGKLIGDQAAAARSRLFEVASVTATPIEEVTRGAQQLVSSGFTPQQVIEGGAAEQLTSIVRAAPAGKPIDQQELAQGVAQFLKAQPGGAANLTPEKFSEVGHIGQALYQSHDFQIQDLSALAKEGAAIAAAIPELKEQMAMFTVLRDVMPAEQAAVGLRNVTSRLKSIAAYPEKVKQLERLGLKPEQVDAEGEDVEAALRAFGEAMRGADKTVVNQVLPKIFEEQGQNAARLLIGAVESGDLDRIRRDAADRAAFDQAYETMTTGHAADTQRAENEKLRQRFGGAGSSVELVAREIELAHPDYPALAKMQADFYRKAQDYGIPGWLSAGATAADIENRLQEQGSFAAPEVTARPERQRQLRETPLSKLRFTPEELRATKEAFGRARTIAYQLGLPMESDRTHAEFMPFATGRDPSAKGFGSEIRARILRGQEPTNISEQRIRELFRDVLKETEGDRSPRLEQLKGKGSPATGDSAQLQRALDKQNQLLERIARSSEATHEAVRDRPDATRAALRGRSRPAPIERNPELA